ncbi:(deoxy)nucleoside triphosphate pyrophosphohydrolase [Candidatus Puniceispirillum sp.]|nr:(deoxy)nucleoside triphosphate pyrophosphohydrolase [Candidatus Puniceispirillum sp.]
MPTTEVRSTMLLVSAAALIDIDGRVLLAQRPIGTFMAGLWEFPGGKIEADETPEVALIRELHEELGINTSESCLAPLSFASHHYDASNDGGAFHLLMMLFICRRWKGRPRSMEGGALKWVSSQHLRNYQMPAADIPLIAALQDLL